MIRRRFIAGAVCPGCGAMDRLFVEGERRCCVACGYEDTMSGAASPEPRTRLGRTPDPGAATPVRIIHGPRPGRNRDND